MRSELAIVVGLAILTSSCALTPQKVTFKPALQVASASIGQGRVVAVTTLDERPRSVIGSRGIGGFGAQITSTQDIASIVQTAILDGLRRQGFNPAGGTGSDPRELRVEIRHVEYSVTPGILTGTLRTEAALKAICIVNNTRQYEQLYRGDYEDWVVVVQFASANEEAINLALSQAIKSVLEDSKLTKCLAQ